MTLLPLSFGRLMAPALASAAMLLSGAAQAQHAPLQRHYSIPAGALSSTLTRFAADAGLSLSVDAALVAGRDSAGLNGVYGVDDGFARLLAGSGLIATREPNGTWVLRPAPQQQAPVLSEVLVSAPPDSQGVRTIGRGTLDALGNGDITGILRVLPNVQFDNRQLHTGQQGEIAPADISIHGAKFYNNLYLMDGMSFNNDINPANRISDGTAGTNNNTAPPSASQGFAIDTSLLCNITVRDANVPAEFGRFSGGVIAADTCAPTRSFGGQVSVERTRSAWTEYKLTPDQEIDYHQSSTAEQQPEFDKWTYRLALQGKPSENIGLIGSFVRKSSEIPLRGYSGGLASTTDGNDKTQRRQSENFFVRGFWTPGGGVEGDLSLLYAPSTGRYFIADGKNTDFELNSGGYGINIGLAHPLGDHAALSHRLSWNSMESSRSSDATTWKGWRRSDEKDWGVQTGTAANGWMSFEGGWGDVDQTQESITWQTKADWEPVRLLGIDHHFQAGFELNRQEQSYHRKTTYTQYTVSADTATCNMAGGGVDTETCSLSSPWNSSAGGQYLRQRLIYFAGKFDLVNTNRAFFVQDEMRLGNVRLRLGARYDNDDLAPKSTLAPRAAAFWDVFGDQRTRLELGANRYYSRNFMVYRAQAQRLALQSTTQLRSLSGGLLTDWSAPSMASNWTWYKLGDMKVPYDDERMVGISQKWLGHTWSLKRVLRESRDEMVLHLRSASNFYWDNRGYSDAKTWALSVESDQPIRIGKTLTSLMFGLDHTDLTTSHADYSDTLSELTGGLDRIIIYDGKPMAWGSRPAQNYNRPWSARLLLSTDIPSARLTISNFFRVRDGFEKMAATDVFVPYGDSTARVWEKHKFGTAITWDLRLNWRLPVATGQEAFINLNVDNVLNRKNEIEDIDNDRVYEKGRQFWVELGYRF
ncbi:TonB-dependent receptor [Thauera linaloolentis]|uniref:TonB dependent outermembrane receptor n=1 Tax=Thauera linaloolentis (strain DSM 12138 / JCM 21573 / CCUG 41526 / CIP 105981 / IAM 15112 / NBRC 102519 / 47Lol) TaxID=1123367 RepID=N6YXS6_THAL4|nr:TonB-dependent receptor [Thauera linaloolentis]ENO86923.1 TonB dependent outermembrane receptor [Thauera linaloolentis 47Lol = DSM 12138]MCM8566666.1 TonB-dependent receptor [Thauera linaloolentis]